MTDLPVNQSTIINFLNNRKEYVSAQVIADEFNVSTKTVYRKINEINNNAGEEIIHAEKGKGFRSVLEGTTLNRTLPDVLSDSSPIQRRNDVLLKLLFNSPNRLNQEYLYKGHYISNATKENDLINLKKIVLRYGLKLEHKGRLISISGSEKNIRETINKLLQVNSDTELDVPIKNINSFDARFVTEQLKFIEEGIAAKLTYPYNVNVFSHLYILIMRARLKKQQTSLISIDNNSSLLSEEVKKYASLYRIAGIVIGNIKNYIVKDLPDSEIDYLFQYLISSRLTPTKEQSKLYVQYSQQVRDFTKLLIRQVNNSMNLNINHTVLELDLVRHIGPMINRLKNGISVENSLLSEIKLEYGRLFRSIQEITRLICKRFLIPEASQNEIGFITLYFAKYLEQHTDLYHVWIVCASGVGTSELLKVKLENSFRNIKVDKVLSSIDEKLNNASNEDVDLIISTVILPKTITAKHLLVSALLNEKDKEAINLALQKI